MQRIGQEVHTMRLASSLPLLLLTLLSSAVLAADQFTFAMVAKSSENFLHPHDITLSNDGKRLYVADNGNHRVAVLDAETLRELFIIGANELLEPHDVVVDSKGRLLVADTGNNRIAIYTVDNLSGKLVGEMRGRITRPEGVAVLSNGDVYATGAGSGNLVLFHDGLVMREVAGFTTPHDVEVDSAGNVWVADSGNHRIIKLNDSLQITRVFEQFRYGFNGPRYLALDSHQNLFVADKYSHNIKVISPNGKLLHVLGKTQPGKGPAQFSHPEGVVIHANSVWFSDTYNNRIVRYNFTLRQ
jgi:DNA-binding beta-propeller fold protein YncE